MPEAPPPSLEPAPRRFSAFLPRFLPSVMYVGLPCLLVLGAVGRDQILYGVDVVSGFYHLRGEVGQALASGHLPVWDPHTRCGSPLLAGMHAGVLYPPTWLAALVSPGSFWSLTVILHLSLSGFFAFAWLRRGLGIHWGAALTGGLVFMLSHFVVARIFAGHIPNISCYPWAAALLWRLERFLSGPSFRRALWLAVCLALMVLAGIPHFVLIALLALLARLVQFVLEEPEHRRARLRTALEACGALGGGALLAAPQLLPTVELLGRIQRTSINSYEFVTSYSMAPENLMTLLVPSFLGGVPGVKYWGRTYFWELSAFVGVSTFALAALACLGRHRQRYLWAGIALAGILFALGSHTPVFHLVFGLVPGASLFRVPGRYLLLFTLAMTLLGALGMDRLLRQEEDSRRHAFAVAVGCGVLCLALLGTWSAFRSPDTWRSVLEAQEANSRAERTSPFPAGAPFEEASRACALRGLAWASVCLAVLAAALGVYHRLPPGRPWCAVLLGLLLCAELGAFESQFFLGYSLEGLEWPPEFVAELKRHPAYPFRIATVDPNQIDTFGKCQLSGLDHVGGYDPMMLRRYTELMNVARGAAVDEFISQMNAAQPGPIFDLLGARFWIFPGKEGHPAGWKAIGILGGSYVYENPRALPRAFLVGKSRILESDSDRLAFLGAKDFDPKEVVVLESGQPESFPAAPGADIGARLVGRTDGGYEVETDRSTPAFLVLTEADYPGWTAEVDGAPAQILPADHLVQAVRIPPGHHRVKFAYRSTYLSAGFALSFLALAVFGAGDVLGRRRVLAPPPA